MRRFLIGMTTLGLAGVGGFAAYVSQFMDPYEQQQIIDIVTQNPDRLDEEGKRMSIEGHQTLAQTVPSSYAFYSQIRYEGAQENKASIRGYEGIDMTSEAGQKAHYQKLLSALPDVNPLISALQNTTDHTREDAAKDFVENDGLSSIATAPLTERMAVQTAVMLSLKLGGHNELADQAYENMMQDYASRKDLARTYADADVIRNTTPRIPQDLDDLDSITFERRDIFNQTYAETAHMHRENAYIQMSEKILNGFGVEPATLLLLNQDTINEYTGITPDTDSPTGYADLDPTQDGEEILFINYDDLTIGRAAPTFQQDPLQQKDFHNTIADAAGVVGEYSYKAVTDDLSEKLLSGRLDSDSPYYAYALAATVERSVTVSEETREQSPSAIDTAAQEFGRNFQDTYKKWYLKTEQAETDYINGKRSSPELFEK